MSSPEHVEKHPSGIAMCRHCGGEVDEDGYARGGEAEEMVEGDVGDEPEQSERTEMMRESAFADAISKRRGAR